MASAGNNACDRLLQRVSVLDEAQRGDFIVALIRFVQSRSSSRRADLVDRIQAFRQTDNGRGSVEPANSQVVEDLIASVAALEPCTFIHFILGVCEYLRALPSANGQSNLTAGARNILLALTHHVVAGSDEQEALQEQIKRQLAGGQSTWPDDKLINSDDVPRRLTQYAADGQLEGPE